MDPRVKPAGDGRRVDQLHRDTPFKSYAGQPAEKREIFHDRGFRCWNSLGKLKLGCLGSEIVISSLRDLRRRTGSCDHRTDGEVSERDLPETSLQKTYPRELLRGR